MQRLPRHGRVARHDGLGRAGHLEAVLGLLLHLVLDPAAGRIQDELVLIAPLCLGGGELGAGAARFDVAGVDDLLQPVEDVLDRRQRPAVGFEVLQGQPDLVAALLDRRADRHGLVVGGGFLAPAQEVLPLALGFLAQGQHLVVGLGNRPTLLLEQGRGVPEGIDRQDVVELHELAVERAGLGHPGIEGVLDHGALVVLGLDDIGQVRQLVADGVDPDQIGAAVVDDVGRVARDEARLQGLRDVRGRSDLDGRTRLQLLDLLAGELRVRDAVAAVEDDRIDRRVRGHAERIRVGDIAGR